MRLEPPPLKLSTLRWIMIGIVWRDGTWVERLVHSPGILLTLRGRLPSGIVSIIGLWSEMSRYAPKGIRSEKTFLAFCRTLPGGEELAEVIAQRILDELNLRREFPPFSPDGTHLNLMSVCDVVARELSGVLRFNLSK